MSNEDEGGASLQAASAANGGRQRWLVYRELGALVGHNDPESFADHIASGSCAHLGKREHDPELCPPPCGKSHEWCLDCGAPLTPYCVILDTDPPPLSEVMANRREGKQ